MRRVLVVWLWSAMMAVALPALAQGPETGFLDRQVAVGDIVYRYQVIVPADYQPTTRWPVILFLHGAGERGSDGMLQTEVGLGRALRRGADRFPAIVVFPQTAGSRWSEAPGDAAIEALDASIEEFSIDEDRVYLTGLSMGSQGSWYLASMHPKRFAALVPICGFVGQTSRRPSFVSDADRSPYVQVAERVRDIPTWIFHGETDSVVSVTESRQMAEALRSVDADVHYSELPGTGHNSWDAAYASPALSDWLFKQRRP